MGGGRSRPAPQIIYQTDPKATAAAQQAAAEARKQAEEARRQARADNLAMQKRLETLQREAAENQSRLVQQMDEISRRTQQENTAQLEKIRVEQQQQMDRALAEREKMEAAFRRQMQETAEEHKAQLIEQQKQHRAEQAQQEAQARKARAQELVNQSETLTRHGESLAREIEETEARLREEEEKLEHINNFLVIEMNARSKFDHEEYGEDCRKVVMIGKTGDGKSTLGNRMMGDTSRQGNKGKFATSGGIESATQVIKTASVSHRGIPFCIADTPGSADTGGRDRIHAQNLVDFLHGIGSVDAFLLVRNVTNKRMNIHEQEDLQAVVELLGEDFWRNVVIAFTRVDDEDDVEDLKDDERVLPNKIGEVFHLPQGVVDGIQVVGCGKRLYQEQVPTIFEACLSCNNGTPFTCDALIAPVEQRQADHARQLEVVHELRRRLEQLHGERGGVQARQQQVQEFVRDLRNQAEGTPTSG